MAGPPSDTALAPLRAPGRSERRCITRYDLGFYSVLVVGAVYKSSQPLTIEDFLSLSRKSLKHCIDIHPILSAVVVDSDTEAPKFARPSTLHLPNHLINLAHSKITQSEDEVLRTSIEQIHNGFSDISTDLPPWKVVVAPLDPFSTTHVQKWLVAFAYSHSHGDGKSGLIFHRTFLEGLYLGQQPDCKYTSDLDHVTPNTPLVPSIEEAGNLSVSLGFLLGPFLDTYMPAFILKLLGRGTDSNQNLWSGSDVFYNAETFRSTVELTSIPPSTVSAVLAVCRKHNATITGLLNTLIAKALRKNLPVNKDEVLFISGTAISLQKHLKVVGPNDMGTFASAATSHFPPGKHNPSTEEEDDEMWQSAQRVSRQLAEASGTLHNQAIGLLRYLNKVRPWMLGKVGKPRDGTWELSNIMAFEPPPPPSSDVLESGRSEDVCRWEVGDVIFSQPADTTSQPMSFNVVSRKGGNMKIVQVWQAGAWGLGEAGGVEEERRFARAVLGSIIEEFERIAKM